MFYSECIKRNKEDEVFMKIFFRSFIITLIFSDADKYDIVGIVNDAGRT